MEYPTLTKEQFEEFLDILEVSFCLVRPDSSYILIKKVDGIYYITNEVYRNFDTLWDKMKTIGITTVEPAGPENKYLLIYEKSEL